MTPVKTYRVKVKSNSILMVFKYDLKGNLRSYLLEDGELNNDMKVWLFKQGKFPILETDILSWKKVRNLEIIETEPDLSFDAFYSIYRYKLKKIVAQRAWERLNKADRIGAILGVKPYLNYLRRQNGKVMQANPATYLNQRYWEDEYGSL